MITITTKLTGHVLSLVSAPQMAAGSVSVDRVQFEFDEAWAGLTKRALFFGASDSEPYAALVNSSGYATIPWEVLQERSKIKFGVYGTEAGSTVPRITSTLLKVTIPEGAWSDSIANSGSPTASLVEQFEAAATEAIEEATLLSETLGQVYPKKSVAGGVLGVDGTVAMPMQSLSIYGRATQDGTPSAGSPVEIAIAASAGSLPIYVRGRNLIRLFSNPTGNGTRCSYEQMPDTVSIRLKCTVTGSTHLLNVDTGLSGMKGRKFTIAADAIEGLANSTVRVFTNNDDKYTQVGDYIISGSLKSTVTIPNDDPIYVRFMMPNSAAVGTSVIYRGVRLVYGEEAVEATPFSTLTTKTLTLENGLPGVPVASGGNYIDAGGQQWICDSLDMESGKYIQRCAVIDSYAGESLPGAWLSSMDAYASGATPSTGAQVVYALEAPVVSSLTDAQKTALAAVTGVYGGTTIFTSDPAQPELVGRLVIDLETYLAQIVN